MFCFSSRRLASAAVPDVASPRFSRNTTDFLELVRKAPRPQGSPSVMDLTQSSISRIAAQARRREARIVVSEGSWKDGEYIGDVNKQGQPDGYGTKVYTTGGGPFKYAAGTKYVGEWLNGKYEGKGCLFDPAGTVRAEGMWRNGKFSNVDWTCRVQPMD